VYKRQIFKGSGFWETDYHRPAQEEKAKRAGKTADESPAKPATTDAAKPVEAKPAPKAESKPATQAEPKKSPPTKKS
jgi:hypothetical protein